MVKRTQHNNTGRGHDDDTHTPRYPKRIRAFRLITCKWFTGFLDAGPNNGACFSGTSRDLGQY